MKKKDKKIISVIIALIIVIIYNFNNQNIDTSNSKKEETIPVINTVTSNLEIYYLDVGQADSTLIINNDTTMLINAGNNEE